MPMLGLGLVQTEEADATRAAVSAAIERGYRLIDTASVYGHEAEVGQAIRDSAENRADVFVATKVWNSDLGYDETMRAFDRSLDALGLEYIDLYMIHWPLIRLRTESWRALVEIQSTSRCRAIGVCNFTVKHLEELVRETGVTPAVNQVEINPFLQQQKLEKWCQKHDILVQTHTPVSRFTRRKGQEIAEMADRYGKTVGQVLVRWCLQRDLGVLVRTLEAGEIHAAADVFDFELALPDVDTINGMDANLRAGWDPTKSP